jgi:hypothetical protein
MHLFIFMTFVFGFSFTFFSHTNTVQSSILYAQTQNFSGSALNTWGVIAMLAPICHIVGLLIRGKYGIHFMQAAMYGGFYVWLWAFIVYVSGDFWFQVAAGAVPNLLFWVWYAWQWRRRYTHNNDPTYSAFVN